MWYGLAADLVVAVHVAYVAYVVVGQVVITIAAPFKRQWVRNPWFRFTHLTAIGIVAYEELRDIRCPLSVWEEQLRLLAGQVTHTSETFMGRLFHDLLYHDLPPIFFTTVHIAAFALIVQAFIMYPPRMFRFVRTAEPVPVVGPA